jgi:ectoine hydroxylase-related dioxygenase (phytanoyl-CoA dioxygenase family)
MSTASSISIDLRLSTHIPELHGQPDPDEISLFRRSGVGVVRGLFSAKEVASIRDAFMAAAEEGPLKGLSETRSVADDAGDPLLRYPRMLHPHRRRELAAGEIAYQTMLDRRILDILEALGGEPALAAQSMFYYKPPGSRGQGLHQDNNPLAVDPGTCMAAWIALDTCDAESGALSVVPGTGPLDLLCDAEKEDRADLFFNGDSLVLPDNFKSVPAENLRSP